MIIIALSIIAGIAIGIRYKVMALISAIIIAAVLAAPAGWRLALASAVLVQFGYLVGMAIRETLSDISSNAFTAYRRLNQ